MRRHVGDTYLTSQDWELAAAPPHFAPYCPKPPNPTQLFTFPASSKSTKILLGTLVNAIISGDQPLLKILSNEAMLMATILGDEDQWLWGIHNGLDILSR